MERIEELTLAHAARIAGVKHLLRLLAELSGTDVPARTARELAGLSCTILADFEDVAQRLQNAQSVAVIVRGCSKSSKECTSNMLASLYA
jgi:hypothetical protein